jgi:hypothetical protein
MQNVRKESLKKISEIKRKEIERESREFHNDKFYNLCTSQILLWHTEDELTGNVARIS